MSKFDELSDRAFQLAEDAVQKLKNADLADKVLASGAALSLARNGAKVALKVARRNPVIAAVTMAGAGVLTYAAYRRRERLKAAAAAEVPPRRVVDAGIADAEEVAPQTSPGTGTAQ